MSFPNPKNPLPGEAISELRASIAEYTRLRAGAAPTTIADSQVANLEKRIAACDKTISWPDVALANLCTIDLLLTDGVRIRLGAWRRRMREVIGDQRFTPYLIAAPDIKHGTDPELRADLAECVRTVFSFYGAYGVGARGRASVTKTVLGAAAVIILVEAILALLLSWHNGRGNPVIFLDDRTGMRQALAYLLATSAAAVVGSVVSVQRRLQDPAVSGDPFFQYIQTTYDRFSVAVISPLFGAIFGMAIYGLIVSKLINIKTIELDNGVPKDAANVAILILFGFLAGFAEQLVPDALTRIATRTLATIAGPPVSTNGPAPAQAGPDPGSGPGSVGFSGPVAAGPPPPPPTTTLESIPADVTSDATELGHDPTLASEPSATDIDKGTV